MARGVAKRPETPDEMYARLLKEGGVIQMFHQSKGVRYITNTEHAIEMARRRGYVDVEYETETVQKPVVKAAEPKAKPEAPKAKSSSKGGE